jgi:putative ABC transport system permease protein
MGGRGAYPDPHVIIISHALWHDWFGGRDDAIGTVMRLDDLPVTVIGVMPRGFAFPDAETRAWLPMPIGSVIDQGVQRITIFGALARLKSGVSPQQAAAEATARARTAPDPGFAAVGMFGSNAPPDIEVTAARDAMTADVRPAIVLLLAAVALLLATATANVGSLQLARATTRRREIAVRSAIGAGGARIVRQLIVESALVGLAGGAAGVALAIALHRALPSLLPADFPRTGDIAVNAPVLVFALVVSLVTSVACGLLPAIPATRLDLAGVLAEDGAASTGGAWQSRSGRLRTIIMASQIAVACLLLVGAVLLSRSFVALMHADRGYDPANILTARLDLPRRYDGARRVAFADSVVERLRATAGVVHVAAANTLPFLTIGNMTAFSMPSPTDPAIKQQVSALTRLVGPEYFQTLRLRLRQGRLLTDADTLTTRPVIVVNRTFADRYLGPAPLGARVPMTFGDGRPDCDVVGIVDDMRQASVTDGRTAEMFVSYRQLPNRLVNGSLILVVRTADDPAAHVSMLRAAVREQDSTVVADSIMTLEERVMTSLAKPRLYAVLLTGFAMAALAIAGVGLFGVLSYGVAQRSREIGVRTALGAQPRDIVVLVLKHAAAVAIAGVAIGLWASFALTKYVAAFLYGVTAHDAVSFVVVAGLLIVVAAIACVVPARRAARIDPMIVLRSS